MFNPWVWKIPWRRAWQPTPVFLPRKFHGQRSLAGYSPWGHKESYITEHKCFYSVFPLFFSSRVLIRYNYFYSTCHGIQSLLFPYPTELLFPVVIAADYFFSSVIL